MSRRISVVILFLVLALGSYLLGSIPSGYLAGRLAGIDIRKVGSGNIGATNVTRTLGKRYGYAVFLADFCKGFGSVMIARFLGSNAGAASVNSHELFPIAAGVLCVIGNAFPVWLRFRGGKGVATSAGVLFGLMPLAALAVTVVWIVTFEVTRYVSLASIAGTIALPVTVFVMLRFNLMHEPLLFYVALGLAAVVTLRHRANFSRLLHGTEQRFRRSED